MEQLKLPLADAPLRSDKIASAIRPAIDALLPLFNLSPRHISIGPLRKKETVIGKSIYYSFSPSIFSPDDEAAKNARGTVILHIIDQVRRSFIEFPESRASFYSDVGDLTAVGASDGYLRLNLDTPLDLQTLADAVCADIDAFLRVFPSDIACCDLYEACSDAGRCICKDQDLAVGCYYKRNLMSGRIFYGSRAGEGVAQK